MDTELLGGTDMLGGFNFSFSSMLAAFVFGVVGFYLFRHGKKNVNYTLLLIGVLLMSYPLFVEGAVMTWLIGGALCGAAYYFR